MAKKTGELQLDRAEGFVDRERFVQRVGVGIMCVFVLAGAVGLLVPVKNGSADLELHVEPQHPGSLQTSITVEGSGSTVDVRQFVFF